MPPKRSYELTDEQWDPIKTHIPKSKPRGRRNDHA